MYILTDLKYGNVGSALKRFKKLTEVDVNYIDPDTGFSILHHAALLGSRPLVKALAASGQCDFLQRDWRGRTAATIAVTVADDPVLGRYLYDRQYAQEQVEGPRPYQPAASNLPVKAG